VEGWFVQYFATVVFLLHASQLTVKAAQQTMGSCPGVGAPVGVVLGVVVTVGVGVIAGVGGSELGVGATGVGATGVAVLGVVVAVLGVSGGSGCGEGTVGSGEGTRVSTSQHSDTWHGAEPHTMLDEEGFK
jgi:hypothetical protein